MRRAFLIFVAVCLLFGLALFIRQVMLQAPAPSRPTGRLTSERSQVFFKGGGKPAQEVGLGAGLTVSDGDEVWTQRHGRALLQFSDLWLRLYDDTTLHADDVTPASAKLALGQGATLVGKTPAVTERVEFTVGTPPTVKIVIAGTLLMVAQPERDGPVVVRLFSGAATVAALRGEASEQIVAPGWALVGRDGLIARPDDEEMRRYARERGWWDAFAEIEREAAGFGPPAARVSADDVTLVFVTDDGIACDEPPALELADPEVAGQEVFVEGWVTPGCADDPIGRPVVDWGDGSPPADGLPARHRYAQAGDYTIAVRVASRSGLQSEAQRVVTILPSVRDSPGTTVRPPVPDLSDIIVSPGFVEALVPPNLTVEIVRALKEASCGQQLGDSVTARVTNTGTGNAGGFALALYLSADEMITPQDYRLSPPSGSTNPPPTRVAGLAAGESVSVALRGPNQIPFSLPADTRTYWLGVIVDDAGELSESDEGDNASPGWPIVVGCLRVR